MAKNAVFIIPLILLNLALQASCGRTGSLTDTYPDGSGSEVAISTVSGALYAMEGYMTYQNPLPKPDRRFSFLPEAWAEDCTNLIPASALSCLSSTLFYPMGSSGNYCTTGGGVVRRAGNLVFNWASGECNAPPTNSAGGAVFTIKADLATGGVSRNQNGYVVTSTTALPTGWQAAKRDGMVVVCTAVNNGSCATARSLEIKGINHIGSSANLANWNHTVSTDAPISITGVGSARTIVFMSVRVQHNIERMTSVTTNARSLTHTDGCCFPTGGALLTSYSNGKYSNKSETLTFTPTCGQATLAPLGGTPRTITLTHCL